MIKARLKKEYEKKIQVVCKIKLEPFKAIKTLSISELIYSILIWESYNGIIFISNKLLIMQHKLLVCIKQNDNCLFHINSQVRGEGEGEALIKIQFKPSPSKLIINCLFASEGRGLIISIH